MNIIIRPARITDVAVLLQFEQGLIFAERPMDTTLKKGELHYYDIGHMISAPHIELLVAESDGELVGCGYARIEEAKHYLQHSQHAYLGFMYTDPAHRGKGVNQKIMAALKDWAILKGMTEMRLDVYYTNESAIKAYEKVGFAKHMIEMRSPVH